MSRQEEQCPDIRNSEQCAHHLVELLAAPAKVFNAEATLHAKAVDAALQQGFQQLVVHCAHQVSRDVGCLHVLHPIESEVQVVEVGPGHHD